MIILGMGTYLNPRLHRLRYKADRSPIRSKPLRFPGQSVDEEIARILNDKADSYAVIGLFMLVIAGFEWWHVLADSPPQPLLLTFVAVPIAAYAAFRLFQLRDKVRRLRLGRDGERAVGQFLEDKLRPLGFFVLHDLCAGNWNIDHIIVGQQGIYTVETKTRSKPRRGCAVVKYDGESVTMGGFKPDRNPVTQARGQAAWLSETLSRSLGLKLPVQAIVVFPGWFVESPPSGSTGDVWVLSGKELPAFILNSRQSIDQTTASTVSHLLRQIVRST